MSYDTEQSSENPVTEDPAPAVTGADDAPADDSQDDGQDEAVRGTADPGRKFREMEVSEDEKREIAEERERRLDPANRPEGAEVDNTDRTFEDGEFKD